MKKCEKSFLQIIYFIVNIIVCYFLSYGIAKPVVKIILNNSSTSFKDNISMLFGMFVFIVLNYIGQRFIVFKNKK